MAAVKPNLVGHGMGAIVSFGDMSSVDGPSTVATANGLGQRNPVGYRVFDDAGNEYVYLPGVASLAQGDFVIYSLGSSPTVARMLNDANTGGAGMVAMALGAFVASCWGWYQIFGITPAIANITTASFTLPAALYRTATTGRLAVTANAKDAVFGAFLAAASVSNVGTAYLSYPFVVDQSTL